MSKVIRNVKAELMRKCERLEIVKNEERKRNDDIEAALVELAELAAAQDDALVEIAEIISEGE